MEELLGRQDLETCRITQIRQLCGRAILSYNIYQVFFLEYNHYKHFSEEK